MTEQRTTPEFELMKRYAAVVRQREASQIVRWLTLELQAFANEHPAYETEYHVWMSLISDSPLDYFKKLVVVPGTLNVYEKIFFHLLRGERGQALELCTSSKLWELKTALDTADSPLMRKVCLEWARNGHDHDKFLRGIMGLVAGDLESTLPLCSKWEHEVLVRHYVAAVHKWSPAQAMEGANTPTKMHELLIAICAETLPEFLTALSASWLNEEVDDDVGVLRVSAHVVIGGFWSTDDNVLIHSWTTAMLEQGGIFESVPYLRFLHPEEQTVVYADILQCYPIKSVLDPATFEMQDQMCKTFDLDLRAAALRYAMVHLDYFMKTPLEVKPLGVLADEQPATLAEIQVITPIKWLEHTRNWDAVVLYSVRLARFWLEGGRVLPLVSLYHWIPFRLACNMSFDPELEGSRNELEHHGKLAVFIKQVMTDPEAAYSRLDDLETYLGSTPYHPLRLRYVPWGMLELARKLQGSEFIMKMASRIMKRVDLRTAFQDSPCLEPFMGMIAKEIKQDLYMLKPRAHGGELNGANGRVSA